MTKDWVQELFIEHGELFQAFLEERLARTEEEVRGLLNLFQEYGVRPGSKILDLNCGIGRHSLYLAKGGYQVTGIDISPRYIARAKELAQEHGVLERAEFLAMDARRVEGLAPRRFDVVINMFTSLGYYDEATDESILRQCLALTEKGGLFVLEIGSRDWIVRHFERAGLARVGDLLVVEERGLNLETSRMENLWTFFEKTLRGYRFKAEIALNHRLYSLHELIALFHRAGWRYRQAYSNLELKEPSLDGSRLILVAQKGGLSR
ncbi:MAG: class I SAM-dependent methyltransferase [Candidatus Acetothermia bacterium]|jgi:SAM-dependent methyltransferase|nr:class I SAM-dependent methyltransferase [Candidatus Acetothermia bacterium]MDH7504932.1 class I SAM-dependent methyltransferase [Candidatus Acetothermia bacterium]